MTIGEKIKALRKYLRMTQEEFSGAIGVTRGHITNLEAGRAVPTELLLNCLSAMYGIPKSWFLDKADEDISIFGQSAKKEWAEKYDRLEENYRKYAELLLEELLTLQEEERVKF